VKFCPRDGSPLRALREDGSLVGEVLAGRYEVLQRLGAGGMGEVYLAEHVKMHRACAVKVMNRLLTSDTEAVARFNREAANASRINHTNVANIYDFGETPEGLIFLAMEYIDGESLSALLDREGSLTPGRAAAIGRQIADALVAAHDLGIVHRDLKPDNIMISRTRDGRDLVKVVDFGIAKASLGSGQEVTRTGFVVGTPEYMSPEQFVGIGVDARSDVFAVGCIMYKMLTGQLAYPGRLAEGRFRERIGEPPPRPSEASPRVPRTFDTLVMKAMAFDPDERFQTALELRDALALEQDSPSQTRRAIRIVRLSRRVWFGAGAVAGVALLIALGMSWRNSPTQPAGSATTTDTTAAIAPPTASLLPGPPPPSSSTATPGENTPAPAAAEPAPAVSAPARQAPPPAPPPARAADTAARLAGIDLVRAQGAALDARARALTAGATPGELQAGAALRERADRSIAARRFSSAIAFLEDARRAWDDAALRARARAESAAVARTPTVGAAPPAAPAETPRPAPAEQPRATPPPPPADPLPEIRATLLRYARALESRSIAGMRRAYPALTAEEESRWRDVFEATDRVAATISVTRVVSVSADSATVEVDAAYEFGFRRGVSGDRAPRASYIATLRRDSSGWHLAALRQR
jgi:serine/threonine protein kinase